VRIDPHPGGAVPTFELVIQELPLAVVIGIWIMRVLARERRPAIKWGAIETSFLLWWATGALTFFITKDLKLTFWELVRMFKLFVVFLYFANNLRSREFIAQVAGVLALTAIFQCVVTLFSYVFKVYVTGRLQIYRLTDVFAYGTDSAMWTDIGLTPPGSDEIWGFFRPGGTIGGFNITCMYIGFFMPLLLAGYLAFKNLASRIVFGVALVICCVALVLTFSRGGWLNVGVGFLFVLYIGYQRGWVDRKIRLQMVGVVVLAVVATFGYGPLRAKLMKRFTFVDSDSAVRPRIEMVQGALDMIRARPVLGVGLNTYIDNTKEFDKQFEDSHELFPVHNKFLLVAAETGLVGVTFFIAFVGFATWVGFQNLKIRDPVLDPINVGILGGLMGAYMHMQMDIYDVYGVQSALFLSYGILTAIKRFHAKDFPEEKGFWRVDMLPRPRFDPPADRFGEPAPRLDSPGRAPEPS
ncbi:MAG: O-antigen ligase family protein, partial [Myxococcales bacterium]|nr:O-antigen ligase family protein [Myxococcales bacterium]